MQIAGRKEAFEKMLEERGVYKKLGVDRSTVANWKKYLKDGKSISEDKMKEMLLKYGCKLEHEEVWSLSHHNSPHPDPIEDGELHYRLTKMYSPEALKQLPYIQLYDFEQGLLKLILLLKDSINSSHESYLYLNSARIRDFINRDIDFMNKSYHGLKVLQDDSLHYNEYAISTNGS